MRSYRTWSQNDVDYVCRTYQEYTHSHKVVSLEKKEGEKAELSTAIAEV